METSLACYQFFTSRFCKVQAERDAPVDVQIGPQLVEEAPQELRSRLWLALIDNPQLCHTYDEGKVCILHSTHASTSHHKLHWPHAAM